MQYKSRKVAILSNWSVTNQLWHATVLPQINVLTEVLNSEQVLVLTLEREGEVQRYEGKKLVHAPIFISPEWYNTPGRILDHLLLPAKINVQLRRYGVSVLLAHGSIAGSLAYKVWKRSKVSFYVNSFEPHADYMLETGVWTKYGLKYRFQRHWENQQKRFASGLMPVSIYYKQQLQNEDVPQTKIFPVPIGIDVKLFEYNSKYREKLRDGLEITPGDIVGIYVGKYGDLYYKDEAFLIYKQCFETIPHFRLIILSPQPQKEILRLLKQYNIHKDKVHIASVPHHEVPIYLSAADFAFATIKSYPSARYCSPVKVGEYWANGLPVLLTEGVGDDSGIIKAEGGGATFNLQEEGSVERALQQIQQILKDPNHRQEIPELAQKYRSPEQIRKAYEYFFGQGQEEQP